ncbi:hypothetical protein Hypma_003604 [Hypsizygus marmoreus]|uniref:Microbial-type PARG catalytic domain-containing protein n=1 Tax=Hypsizygus marmoreus TaxID=39966 RepID=A0A369J3J1_HYPMA|nr:hypothetical protein Hypma_003604 [Hypsizygus marmoreus]
MPSLRQRQEIAHDTIARSPSLVQSHTSEGATLDSFFLTIDDLPALDPSLCPGHPRSKVAVLNADSFTAARDLIQAAPDGSARGKTAVLNLASDEERAGGWEYTLCKTQVSSVILQPEEALCYSSTLYATLKPSYYPWPNLGPGSVAGVFSPGVLIFRHDLDHECVELPIAERRVVSVLTVAAPRDPKLTKDGGAFANKQDLEDLRGKIRLVYRMAARHGQEYLVLGAMGCGVYFCPPRLVAEEMKAVLLEDEFKGWFRQVVFAVYSKLGNGAGNFAIFDKAFSGVEV